MLNQNFEPGKTVNVTSLEGTTLFTTLLGTKTNYKCRKNTTHINNRNRFWKNRLYNNYEFLS
jgi:hypothetical protein